MKVEQSISLILLIKIQPQLIISEENLLHIYKMILYFA